MIFQRERWVDVFDELLPLLQMANDELEPFADSMPLDMDFEAYAEMEQVDVLHVITARLEGELVGHHLILITDDLRRKSIKQAQTDTIYMRSEHRNSGLIAFSESYLRQLGVQIWAASSRDCFDTSILWMKAGFNPLERVLIKRLEG